jgi:hypothetical protein
VGTIQLAQNLRADVQTLWAYHNMGHRPRRCEVGIHQSPDLTANDLAGDVTDVAEIGHTSEKQMSTQATNCGKSASQSLCASCTCPRSGSRRMHTDSGSVQLPPPARSGSTRLSGKPLVIEALVPLVMERRKPVSQ